MMGGKERERERMDVDVDEILKYASIDTDIILLEGKRIYDLLSLLAFTIQMPCLCFLFF